MNTVDFRGFSFIFLGWCQDCWNFMLLTCVDFLLQEDNLTPEWFLSVHTDRVTPIKSSTSEPYINPWSRLTVRLLWINLWFSSGWSRYDILLSYQQNYGWDQVIFLDDWEKVSVNIHVLALNGHRLGCGSKTFSDSYDPKKSL